MASSDGDPSASPLSSGGSLYAGKAPVLLLVSFVVIVSIVVVVVTSYRNAELLVFIIVRNDFSISTHPTTCMVPNGSGLHPTKEFAMASCCEFSFALFNVSQSMTFNSAKPVK